MSKVASHIGLECEPSHVIVILNPSLSEQQWGDVDAVTQKVLGELLARKNPTCLIDLSPLNYMGSSMVALVVRVWKTVKAQNGKMAVVCSDDFVLGVLRVAGLDKLWTIVPDRATAFRQLKLRGQAPTPAAAVRSATINTLVSPTAEITSPVPMPAPATSAGWGLVIAALAGLLGAATLISVSDQLQLESRAKLGLVIACSCLGLVCGAVAALSRRGLPRFLAGASAVLALGLGIASVLARETTWQGIRDIGAAPVVAQQTEDDGAEEKSTPVPEPESTPAPIESEKASVVP